MGSCRNLLRTGDYSPLTRKSNKQFPYSVRAYSVLCLKKTPGNHRGYREFEFISVNKYSTRVIDRKLITDQ